MEKRDIFKRRKNKAYKNLVSFGKYGVVLGTAFLAFSQAEVTLATELSGVSDNQDVKTPESEDSGLVPGAENLDQVQPAGAPAEAVSPAGITAEEAAAQPALIQPTTVDVKFDGADRAKNNIAEGSELNDGQIVTVKVNMDLPDSDIKAGDYLDIKLPNHLQTVPNPQTIAINDATGTKVADLILQNNRDNSGTFTGTTGKVVFTDGFKETVDKKIAFDFNVSNTSFWGHQETKDLAVTINSTGYNGPSVSLYRSLVVDFGTSTRLWQLDTPYKLYHQSEVAIVNREEPTYTTVVYKLAEDTLDYARYDVATIREKGYDLLLGTARNNRRNVNTKNNDLGITAEVDDEGTTVTLRIPNMPAGFGLNGGSIPVDLSAKAIAEQHVQWYNSTMDVYVDPVGSEPDLTRTPNRVAKGKNTYQFTGASASSANTNVVIVNHVDEKGTPLAPRETQTGLRIGTPYTTNPLTLPNYELVAKPVNSTGTVTKDATGAPITVTYVYRPTQTVSEETKTVTRTIKYVDDKGNEVAPSVEQTVIYTRTVTTNDVTGDKTYGDWTANQDLPAVTSPEVANYTPDKAVVPVLPTTPESSDVEETVIYTPTTSE
ncbi:mucin-binding protein, partial [Streptococcus rupicaprae]